jgi:hypothetical protein
VVVTVSGPAPPAAVTMTLAVELVEPAALVAVSV